MCFARLKGFIKRNWNYYRVDPDQGLDALLTWCIYVVGTKEQSAKAIFDTQA